MESLSLYELNALVKQSIRECMPDEYWVQAELSDVRSNTTGHCYLEFIQKDPRSNSLVAKARGTIWANVFRLLKPYFEKETGQSFVSGLKVLVKVSVEFHELYGYSLTVSDIDPTYTLGDMARRRREILNQLEEEGVLSLNKELELPVPAQRIAVISSATAAGYGDFSDQLKKNPYGFVFQTKLFPAVMQGDRVEETIIAALDAIYSDQSDWDVVVIIRGGGATSDLSGFDTYLLAANCAQFPLPIITGIGHERDDTVLDLVAHTRVKTPTAAAEFLINHLREAAAELESYIHILASAISSRMNAERNHLDSLAKNIPTLIRMRKLREEHRLAFLRQQVQTLFSARFAKEKHHLQLLQQQIRPAFTARLSKEKHRLSLLEQQAQSVSPEHLLKRGYSITFKDGKAVTDVNQLKPGDKLTTRLWKGEVISEVK